MRRYSVFSKTHWCGPEGLKTAHCAVLWQCVILNNRLIIAMSVTCQSLTQPPEQNHSVDSESHLEGREQLSLIVCLSVSSKSVAKYFCQSFSPSFPFALMNRAWTYCSLKLFPCLLEVQEGWEGRRMYRWRAGEFILCMPAVSKLICKLKTAFTCMKQFLSALLNFNYICIFFLISATDKWWQKG